MTTPVGGANQRQYLSQIKAWVLYDWADSAFATTVLATVLPIFYASVVGITLPSESTATRYYTITLGLGLAVVALASPLLGILADLGRKKKRFLAGSVALGTIATGLLALTGEGQWLAASVLAVLANAGFATGNVFYDSLLPHVARPEDRDRVSARGYAFGYLGGGLLLVVNAAMIFALGLELGARLSFLTVAVWWAYFSLPLFRRVPEPPADSLEDRANGLSASWTRLQDTFRHLRRYRELFRFLLAFLVYNDGINTVILVAAIYGTELGFSATELILAIVLVQFAGIGFSLLFGRIPSPAEPKRSVFIAFVLFNLVALPGVGILASRSLDRETVGRPGPPFVTEGEFLGEGEYQLTATAGRARFSFNGERIQVRYTAGPDRGEWDVLLDGVAVKEGDEPLTIDGYNRVERIRERIQITAATPGHHTLEIVATDRRDPDATGNLLSPETVEVQSPLRRANLAALFGGLVLLELIGAVVAMQAGPRLPFRWLGRVDTKRTIMLALAVYAVIAVWGFFLDTLIEFWFLALMVAMVQGGSQALSRSLYASLSPPERSGEFFGFFSVVSKFAAILGPLLFALVNSIWDSSRPAVASLAVFFIAGALLLARVNVEEGVASASRGSPPPADKH